MRHCQHLATTLLNATVVLRLKQAKQNEQQTFPMVVKTLFLQKPLVRPCYSALYPVLVTYNLFIQF